MPGLQIKATRAHYGNSCPHLLIEAEVSGTLHTQGHYDDGECHLPYFLRKLFAYVLTLFQLN